MKRAALVLAFVLGSIPVARAAHPQGLVDAAGLARLRAARTTTHAELATALANGLRAVPASVSPTQWGDRRLYANAIGGTALAATLVGDAATRTKAKSIFLAAANQADWGFGEGDDLNRGHMILNIALGYDVLFDVLSDAERASVRTRLGNEAQRFATAYDNRIWWATDWLQNHNWINVGAMALAGYVLEGEDARAAGWVSRALKNAARLDEVRGLVVDGSWHEGVGYQQYGWSYEIPWWLAALRRGADVAHDSMLAGYGAYRRAVMLPSNARHYVTTHGDWSGWSGPGSSQVLRFVASRFRDGTAQHVARRWVEAGSRSSQPYDLYYLSTEYVAYDPTVAETAEAPLDFYGEDQQVAVMRSNGSTSGLTVALKSGVLGGRANWERLRARTRFADGSGPGNLNIGHNHMDDLGVWLHGDGEWLLPECVGYNIGRSAGPKAWMSEFHNTLLFDGAGQLGDDRGGVHAALSFPWFFQREAQLELVTSSAHYAFARGDGTRLYPATVGLQGLGRLVGLARDGHVVLRDTVALGAPRAVEQVFHFLDGATQGEGWIRGNSKNDRVLGVRVVSPPAFAATIGTQTADKLVKQFEPDGSVSIVKVRPAVNEATPTFLELLWPTRGASWAQRPAVLPLDPARPGSGLAISLAAGRERWAFGVAGARVPVGELVLDGPELAIVRTGVDEELRRIVMLGGGSVLDARGRSLVRGRGAGVVEIEINGALAVISGSDRAELRFFAPGVNEVRIGTRAVAWHREGDEVVLGAAAPVPVVDAGTPVVDAGTPSEPIDAGAPVEELDAGAPDGRLDAGSPEDEVDAGSPEDEVDAGSPGDEIDAGVPDETVDAGSPGEKADSGTPEEPVDAGGVTPADAGTESSHDAGEPVEPDAGTDADGSSEEPIGEPSSPAPTDDDEPAPPRGCECAGGGLASASWLIALVLGFRRRAASR